MDLSVNKTNKDHAEKKSTVNGCKRALTILIKKRLSVPNKLYEFRVSQCSQILRGLICIFMFILNLLSFLKQTFEEPILNSDKVF